MNLNVFIYFSPNTQASKQCGISLILLNLSYLGPESIGIYYSLVVMWVSIILFYAFVIEYVKLKKKISQTGIDFLAVVEFVSIGWGC